MFPCFKVFGNTKEEEGGSQSLGNKEACGHFLSFCLSGGYGEQKKRRREESTAVIRVQKRFQLSLLQGAKDVIHSKVKDSQD